MATNGKKIIVAHPVSDVPSFTVDTNQGDVMLGVNDADSDDSSDGRPLVVARLLPSQAIKLARALLLAAGVEGRETRKVWAGRVVKAHEFVFID